MFFNLFKRYLLIFGFIYYFFFISKTYVYLWFWLYNNMSISFIYIIVKYFIFGQLLLNLFVFPLIYLSIKLKDDKVLKILKLKYMYIWEYYYNVLNYFLLIVIIYFSFLGLGIIYNSLYFIIYYLKYYIITTINFSFIIYLLWLYFFLLIIIAFFEQQLLIYIIFYMISFFFFTYLIIINFNYVFIGYIIIILYIGSILILFLFFGILINNSNDIYINQKKINYNNVLKNLFWIYNIELLCYVIILISLFFSSFNIYLNNSFSFLILPILLFSSTNVVNNIYFILNHFNIYNINILLNYNSGYGYLLTNSNLHKNYELEELAINLFQPSNILLIHTTGYILLVSLVSLIFCVNWTNYHTLFNDKNI